jgi:co-chaperonin GroES (HSP10)
MKAIGRNLIINKAREGTTKTEGGLLLAENQRDDIRYIKATVVSAGSEVAGVKPRDVIYFDRHAGHKIEVDKQSYHVIKSGDIVVVL